MGSLLKQNGDKKHLIVYYDRKLDNFSEAIEAALREHGLKAGKVPVLCLPAKELNCGSTAQD